MSFDTCLRHLTEGDLPRVWSLIVTIFGDLAQGDGDALSSQTIGAITGAMGIKPEASRVALHRLKGDGWLASRRVGRGSEYTLTPMGRRESEAAAPRIYEAGQDQSDWHVIVAAPGESAALAELAQKRSHVSIAPGVAIGPAVPGMLNAPGAADLPPWVQDAICPPDQQTASAALLRRFRAVKDDLPADLDPSQSIALRVLIVHGWRRLILRQPALPARLFPAGWKAQDCYREMTELLARLPRPGALG